MAEPAANPTKSWWRRATAALPMRLALLAVTVVWLLGCVWSFEEQTAFAASREFAMPQLLPLVIDGFAVAMAGVAWAASLDARPATAARLATLIAVAGSAASNGTWAWIRTGRDLAAVTLAVAVPLAANLAFEVLLAELRRQVQRRRGLSARVPIPHPRMIRLGLAPVQTIKEWRSLVLDLTMLTQAPVPEDRASTSATSSVSAIAPRVSTPPPGQTPEPNEPTSPGPENLTQPGSTMLRTPRPRTGMTSAEIPSRASTRPIIGDRRLDPRAVDLADRLRALDSPEAVTGDRVGELLGISLAPRSGRRLLGQARTLLQKAAPAAPVRGGPGMGIDPEYSG